MQTVVDLAGLVPENALLIIRRVALLVVLALAATGLWKAYRYTRTRPLEDTLTIVSASIATGVSAQGMWRFSGDVLGFDGPLRLLLFAFIEVAVITSAVRARRSIRAQQPAGVDGLAVWVLTCLTAVLSSMDAHSLAEAVFRLASPLVAAWLWERGMAIERHRTGRARIHWRITPERVLVRVGLAEATDRTASDVAAQRRRTRIALAAKRARALRDAGAKPTKVARAVRRMEAAVAAAVRHIGLGIDEAQQQLVQQETAAVFSAAGLLDVAPASSWAPARAEEPSDFGRLADETQQLHESLAVWKEVRAARDEVRAAEANILMLTSDMTSGVTPRPVIKPVNDEVIPPAGGRGGEAPASAPDVTPAVTSQPVIKPVIKPVMTPITFDVNDPSVFAFAWPPPDLLDMTYFMTPEVTQPEVITPVNPTPPAAPPTADTKVAIMRAHWLEGVAVGEYPRVSELAEVADADPAQASRYRAKWVKELPTWQERRRANAKGAAKDKVPA